MTAKSNAPGSPGRTGRWAIWLYDEHASTTRAFFTTAEVTELDAIMVWEVGEAKASQLGEGWECHFEELESAKATYLQNMKDSRLDHLMGPDVEQEMFEQYSNSGPTGLCVPPDTLIRWLVTAEREGVGLRIPDRRPRLEVVK